jgi:hypothetical protein
MFFLFFSLKHFMVLELQKENSFDPATMASSLASSSSHVPITQHLLLLLNFTPHHSLQKLPPKLFFIPFTFILLPPHPLATDPQLPSPTTHSSLSIAAFAAPSPVALEHISPPTHPLTTKLRDGTRRPKPFTNYKLYYSTKHPLLALHTTSTFTNLPHSPIRFSQAAKSPQWLKAMSEEFATLKTNHTWTLYPDLPIKTLSPINWFLK